MLASVWLVENYDNFDVGQAVEGQSCERFVIGIVQLSES